MVELLGGHSLSRFRVVGNLYFRASYSTIPYVLT